MNVARKRRDWSQLGERQQKRYLAAGRKRGMTENDVIQHYVTGGNLSTWRGHKPRQGVNEKAWTRLRQAAIAAGLDVDAAENNTTVTEILQSLLDKGFSVAWIHEQLALKKDSRLTYRSARMRRLRDQGDPQGYFPGRGRYWRRVQYADIEIYYYH